MAAAAASEKPKEQQLKELLAAASHDYAHKSYDKASDLYAQAAEIQDEINGEMNPANAELLYAYGRCLHHLAVSKSDVLGGKVAGSSEGTGATKKAGKKRKRDGDAAEGSSSAAYEAVATQTSPEVDKDAMLTEKVLEKAIENKDGMQVAEEEKKAKQESKPFFQISGDDEEWEDEDDEDYAEDDEAADQEADEEEDDLATAFEVLDVARVLLQRQIEELQSTLDQAKSEAGSAAGNETSKQIWTARDRLADTHDLQAEISLENERFADAVTDARASLALKKELYEESHGVVSEAHFKLSLALELGSVTTAKDAQGIPVEGGAPQVDQGMRDEAAQEMESAIRNTKLRAEKEMTAMSGLSGEELRKKQEQKKDSEEIIAEMEQRLEDLRNQPVSLNTASGPAGAALDNNPLGGILGEMLGESQHVLKARLEQETRNATDISAMVKHKKKPQAESGSSELNGNQGKGKRKVSDASADELAGDSKRKKSPSA